MEAAREEAVYSADYIWEAPDDHLTYEVINGRLVRRPVPPLRHQTTLGFLLFTIGMHVRQSGLGDIVPVPGVVLDIQTAVRPDLVYVSKERAHIISERGAEGAPDLIVEVLSEDTADCDRGIKMRRYAASGVPYYWILDPDEETLEAYRLGADGYALTGVFRRGNTFRPDLFPDLEIVISEIWE